MTPPCRDNLAGMEQLPSRPTIGQPGPLVALAQSVFGDGSMSGVVAARDAALRLTSPNDPHTDEALADLLVQELLAGATVRDLSQRYAPYLVRLGRLRDDSTFATAHRRLQEFLKVFVWPRIPDDAVSGHVRAGRRGGRPKRRDRESDEDQPGGGN